MKLLLIKVRITHRRKLQLIVKNHYELLINSIVRLGLMLESEKKIFEIMDQKSPMSKYWMPLVWATNIINTARKQELITSDHIVQTLLVELSDIRRRLGALIGYDTVCVPLVYTQVTKIQSFSFNSNQNQTIHSSHTGCYTGLIHLFYCGTARPSNDTES